MWSLTNEKNCDEMRWNGWMMSDHCRVWYIPNRGHKTKLNNMHGIMIMRWETKEETKYTQINRYIKMIIMNDTQNI